MRKVSVLSCWSSQYFAYIAGVNTPSEIYIWMDIRDFSFSSLVGVLVINRNKSTNNRSASTSENRRRYAFAACGKRLVTQINNAKCNTHRSMHVRDRDATFAKYPIVCVFVFTIYVHKLLALVWFTRRIVAIFTRAKIVENFTIFHVDNRRSSTLVDSCSMIIW